MWLTGADGCARLVGAGIEALAAGLDEPTGKGEFDRRFPEVLELPRDVDAHGIRDAVQRLLDDPSFRDAAMRTGEALTAMPSAVEVAEILANAYG